MTTITILLNLHKLLLYFAQVLKSDLHLLALLMYHIINNVLLDLPTIITAEDRIMIVC